MALLPLNFDVLNKKLVVSETNPQEFFLGSFYQEDALDIQFRALVATGNVVSPFFERVSLSGYSLTISIGTAGTVRAQQASWTASSDGTLLTGTLDLATSGISGLTDNSNQTFEIKLVTGSVQHKGQFNCVIKRGVAIAGTLNPVVSDTALGRNEAAATFMPKNDLRSFTVKSLPNGDKTFLVYWHDDGSMRTEEIT